MYNNLNEFWSPVKNEEKQARKKTLIEFQKMINEKIEITFTELDEEIKGTFSTQEEIDDFKNKMRPRLQVRAAEELKNELRKIASERKVTTRTEQSNSTPQA